MGTHPLQGDFNWVHVQPSIMVRSSFVAIPRNEEKHKPEVRSVSGTSICREGIIHHLRRGLISGTCSKKTNRHGTWSWMKTRTYTHTHDFDLEDSRGKKPGSTALSINPIMIGAKRAERQRFLHLADAIIGPIGVLINPDRPRNSCPSSTIASRLRGGRLIWYGVDNTILYSPALVAVFSGLYRQCALLCRAGRADETLSLVDRREIRRIMADNDEVAAQEIVKRLRRWIEVPVPRRARHTNVAFPKGYFRRLEQITRAVRKHGTKAVFEDDLRNSWGLTKTSYSEGEYSYSSKKGLWSVWGTNEKETTSYQRIVELSRSRRKVRPAVAFEE